MIRVLFCVLAFCRFSLSALPHLPHRDSSRVLRTLLLDSYYKFSHPYKENEADFSMIAVFTLVSLIDLDQRKETFSFTGHLGFQWLDPDLSWEHTEYAANVSNMNFEADDIWTPQVQIGNGVGTLVLNPESFRLRADPSGLVTMTTFNQFYTKCTLDMTSYPFDTQLCFLAIILKPKSVKVKMLVYQKTLMNSVPSNTEWTLEDVSVSSINMTQYNFVINSVGFSIRRKSTFYVMNVIFPMLLLSVLNACVFVLPAESGEKISFLISILVSYAVFLIFIIEVMPKSETPSRMAIYLVLVLAQSCLAIVATLALLNFHHHGAPRQRVICVPNRTSIDPDNPVKDKTADDVTTGKVRSVDRKMFLVFLVLALLSVSIFWF
ncbi:neuronal acetylcholine receptor subunit beta-3-like [Gigantopelta aegis]|uniref:neuronal acetylcholine receptor subunit beta-3-like n=1 Tax=Gigantopelta aegis TaxID=1735272 RepID=UPI001B887887|nr:neuronal acetylcholine receptor subunit beta-3-like [Gigantopelta aegis]